MIDDKDIDNLLNSLLNSYDEKSNLANMSLKERFELKLEEYGINKSVALGIMDMESRTLNGLLSGSITRVDFNALMKMSSFIEVSYEEGVRLFLKSLGEVHEYNIQDIDKRKFIIKNFNLAQLKKIGIIESSTDFKHIEDKIVEHFGYDSIFDYRKDVVNPAFSSGKLHKNSSDLYFWIEEAYQSLRKINNHYPYDTKALIEYFPTIRWNSLNIEKGLLYVTRALFKLGITVIYKPKFTTLHMRGATFAVNGKPCIVLTDYKGYYPTLWFALIHELHHVLFDWEQILVNTYHISDESDLFSINEMESEANKFARDYLFSDAKMEEALVHIDDAYYIEQYATQNQVHPSIVYIFYAHDADSYGDKKVWGRIHRHMPDINKCLNGLGKNMWQKPIKEIVKFNKEYIFNN